MVGFQNGRRARFAALALLFSSLFFLTCTPDDGQSNNPTGPWETGLDRPAPSIRSFDSPMLVRVTLGGGYDPSVCADGIHLAYSKPDAGIAIKDLRRGGTVVPVGPGTESDWCRANPALLLLRRGGELCVYNSATHSMVWSCVPDIDDGAVWSPIGNEIAAQGDEGIVVVRYPSGARSVVPCSDSYGCDGEEPTWSPDGQWIAFEDGMEIMKVPRHGGTAVEVIGGLNDVTEPAWSPDGRWIAFVMDSSGSRHIWIADPTGRNKSIAQVTHGPFSDRSPAWSPDSRSLYFSRQPSSFESREFEPPDIWVTSLPEPSLTPGNFFPLDIGNMWTYQEERFSPDGRLLSCDTITMSLIRDTIIGSERWAVSEFGLVTVRPDGFWMCGFSGTPFLKFKYPAIVGDHYEYENEDEGGHVCSVESVDDCVEGPTGNLICVRYWTGRTYSCDFDREWVAPGVGLVRGEGYGHPCELEPWLESRSVLIAVALRDAGVCVARGISRPAR